MKRYNPYELQVPQNRGILENMPEPTTINLNRLTSDNYRHTHEILTGGYVFSFLELEACVELDASNIIQSNQFGILLILLKKQGDVYSYQETNEMRAEAYRTERLVKQAIWDRIYNLLPDNITRCRMFRNYINKHVNGVYN